MQYLTYISITVPYINQFHSKNIWVIVRKQNFNQNFYLIQGEIFRQCMQQSYNSCFVQYLTYISITVPSINQFHSKTSELLSEKQNFNQNFNLKCGRRLPTHPPFRPTPIYKPKLFCWKIRLKSVKSTEKSVQNKTRENSSNQ